VLYNTELDRHTHATGTDINIVCLLSY